MKTKITLLVQLLIYSGSLAFAQPGTLDNAFGTGGKVTTPLGYDGNVTATAIQQDGKILVAGFYVNESGIYDILVIRYNGNGTLDNTFGENGKVIIDFDINDAYAAAVAIQPDGKIIVAGRVAPDSEISSDGLVIRLSTNGTLDGSFNSGGKLAVDFGGWDYISSIAIQNDGRIMVAGGSLINNYTISRIAVARINGSDGHFDGSFGTAGTGKVITVVGGSSAANSVAIQSDGRIIVAGNTGSSDNATNHNFLVVRYNSNGILDNTFGNNGKTTIDFGGDDYATSIAIQSNGVMVVAGQHSGKFIAVTKLGPLGNRAGNFGVSGKVTTLIGNSCEGNSVVIQPDNKIIVAGYASDGNPNYDFALVRYNSNGSPDNSFGANGIVTTGFGHQEYGEAIALQQDLKIVVAGYSELTATNKIAIARYNGDPVSQTVSSKNISAATDKKLAASSSIKIFPNPAKDLLSIDGMDASTKTISIVDMNGRIMQTTTTANSTHTWNIASLPAGTYYLLIDDKKKKTSLKFVKE